MDTIETILQQLSRMGVLNPSRGLAQQIKLMRTLPNLPDQSTLRAMKLSETLRAEAERLRAGYGLTNIARSAIERDNALRIALANSYTNLTGTNVLASKQYASIASLQKQIEQISSPAMQIQRALATMRAPDSIIQIASKLDVDGSLIGEFGFAGAQEQSSQRRERESPEREEVESRIVRVDFIQQKVFEAIQNSPALMFGLAPREFEEFTAELLSRLGFEGIQLTPRSGDGGRDVVATKIINDIPVIMAFECKLYQSNKIGPNILRALLGTITHGATRASMGVLVTTSSFTSGARSYIATEASIDGKDFQALSRWLAQADGKAGAG